MEVYSVVVAMRLLYNISEYYDNVIWSSADTELDIGP